MKDKRFYAIALFVLGAAAFFSPDWGNLPAGDNQIVAAIFLVGSVILWGSASNR